MTTFLVDSDTLLPILIRVLIYHAISNLSGDLTGRASIDLTLILLA